MLAISECRHNRQQQHEQRQRRNRLQQAHRRQYHAADSSPPLAEDAQCHAHHDRRQQRAPHQVEMFAARACRIIAAPRRSLRFGVHPEVRARKSAAACDSDCSRDSTTSLSVCIVDSEIAPSSRRIAASNCRVALGRVEPIEPHGVVARKELQIVFQHHQIAAVDHGVGRIDVDHVDFACQELAIGEVMVDPDDVALLQVVARCQRRPAVAAIEKFVRQRQLQFGQALEIGDS